MTDINYSDGHSPETCNYRACNAPEPKGPCPFVADERSPGSMDVTADYKLSELRLKAAMFDELQDVLKRILQHK